MRNARLIVGNQLDMTTVILAITLGGEAYDPSTFETYRMNKVIKSGEPGGGGRGACLYSQHLSGRGRQVSGFKDSLV